MGLTKKLMHPSMLPAVTSAASDMSSIQRFGDTLRRYVVTNDMSPKHVGKTQKPTYLTDVFGVGDDIYC